MDGLTISFSIYLVILASAAPSRFTFTPSSIYLVILASAAPSRFTFTPSST